MSQSYRQLSEGLSRPAAAAGAPFAADVRKARNWVAALPRANAAGTQASLAQALESLAVQRLEGGQRLAVLEELRAAAAESIGLLKRDYAGSALPLAPSKAASAQRVEAFHVLLAEGYRRAVVELCAPAGNIPMLRGNSVALALARSAWHYSQCLAVAWRVYRAPAPGSWQGLHRVHRFAVEHRMDAKQIDDTVAGAPVEIRAIYLQALLMAVTHPLAFSQLEQDQLWQATRDFAPRCVMLRSAPDYNAPAVPEDLDRGPGPAVAGDAQTQWFDMRAFCDEVDAALARQRDGFADLMPLRGAGVRMTVEALQRLKRSFGLAAARTNKRLAAEHSLRTVIGLSGLHFYLSGQRDFEAFVRQAMQHVAPIVDRAAWASGGTQAARVPVHGARVLDQSLGGYRIQWDHADQIRARVGEVVGLSFSEPDEFPEWMLGVIRWLRYEDGAMLSAGVELVSRRTNAVGLRVHESDGSAREPIRALEIEGLDSEGEANFLAPSAVDSGARRIEIVRDAGDRGLPGLPAADALLAGVDVMFNAGDYALLRPLRADLVTEADGAGSGAEA